MSFVPFLVGTPKDRESWDEIRLNVLREVVDKFVLVEAGETHTGKLKPYYFKENEARFSRFLGRIIYIKVESFPKGHDAWWNENYQRNEILRGLEDAKPDDVILISDLDEIPRPEEVKKLSDKGGVWRFNHVSYGFYLNMKDLRCRNMCGTVLLQYKDLISGFDDAETHYDEFLPKDLNMGTTVTKIRRRSFPKSKGGEHVVKNAGWHFTCLGGAKALLSKMRAVAPHHDFNPDDPTLTVRVGAAFRRNMDIFYHDDGFFYFFMGGGPIIRIGSTIDEFVSALCGDYSQTAGWKYLRRG